VAGSDSRPPSGAPAFTRSVVRLLSIPADILIWLVAPRRENVVWDMLLRQQRRGAMRWPILPLQIALAAGTVLFAAMRSGWTVYWSIALVMVTAMVFISVLRPPTQISVRYRKSGCADHMLTAPIGASDYAEAFARTFLLAAVQAAVVICLYAAGMLFAGEPLGIQPGLIWFLAGILSVAWITYWVAIRGGLVQLLPLFYLLAFLASVRGVLASHQGDDLVLFMKSSVALFWIGGFAIYRWCHRDYADVLRRQLYR
jgi:hypothetical protein